MFAVSFPRPLFVLTTFLAALVAAPSASLAEDNRFSANIKDFTTDLPLIHVNTGKKTATKELAVPAVVTIMEAGRNSSTDLLRATPNFKASFQVRGNSSAKFPKKQFDLELVDEKGEDFKAPLLGMPKHHKWVLASNYADRALIRNSFAFALSRSLKQSDGSPTWASNTRPVELFINGKYQGIYILTEKIDTNKDRLNLGKVNWEVPEESPFLVKVEKTKSRDPNEYFFLESGNKVSYVEPKAKHFAKQDPATAKKMKAHIRRVMTRFENAILAIEDGDYQTYRSLIDVTSFQNFMFVHEIMKNVDGFRRSVYVYYKNGKLHLGPIWDCDLALSNLTVWGQYSPKYFQVGHNFYIDFNRENFWFRTLLKDPEFQRSYVRRYRELRRPGGPLGLKALLDNVNSHANPLKGAWKRNFTVWDYNGHFRDGPVILFVPKFGDDFTHEGEIHRIRQWLMKRVDWLDENIDAIGENTPSARATFAREPQYEQ